MNLFGAFGVGVNVFVQQAYPSIAIQIIWVAIALFGIYQDFSPQNHHKQK